MTADFRLALRQLRRTPGFTAMVVATLALGIGASTAIYSVAQQALFKPLPFPESDRAIRLWAFDRSRGITRTMMSFVRYDYIRQRQQSFSAMGAAHEWHVSLTGRGQAERLSAKLVTAGFFRMFGMRPVVGREFLETEDQPGARPVAMISEGLWRRIFQGSENALGETLVLEGTPHTVVGVVPETFAYPFGTVDVWTTRAAEPAIYTPQQVNDGAAYLNPSALLKPGVSLRDAQQEIDRLVAEYRREFPQRVDAITEVELLPFREELVGQQRQAIYLLFGAVGLVHLIACFNVANLLLARFASRSRENAMRLALGSSPQRLVGQFLAESLLLALGAAAMGIGLAAALLRIFRFALEEFLPRATPLAVDPGALGFMLGLTLLTGAAVGLIPGLIATRRDLLEMLKESSHGATQGLTPGSFRRALLVAEVAVSLVLLIVAGLVAISFARLQSVDPGVRKTGIFLAAIDLPRGNYQTDAQLLAITRQIEERLGALPNVQRVAFTDSPPLSGGPVLSPYAAADRPLPPMNERLIALRNIVSAGYLETAGIPLKEGRGFTADDHADTPAVALLNETMAQQLFPDVNPVGRKVVLGITNRTAEVIGLVGDVRTEGLATPPKPEIYFSFAQRPRRSFTLVLRTDDEPAAIAPSVRAVLREIDPDIPVNAPRSIAAEFWNSLSNQRFAFRLLGLFAGTALVLALLGIYSVIAYSVQQRATEIAVRLMLGATPAEVRRMIVTDGMRLTAAGIVLGLAGAYFCSEMLRRILFAVPTVHVPVYAGVAVLLVVASIATCWLAARRVARIEPIAVLRTD
jgi:putative ABC transport system permease protein